MRIVFCTGADRTGKSTLIEEFRKRGWVSVHFGPPKGSPYMEYRKFVDETLKDPANSDKKFILDRFMYCEFPYSRHYGRPTDMTSVKMNELEDDILRLDPNAKIIYCETSLEGNWDRIEAEGKHEFENVEQLERLRKNYIQTFMASKLDYITYNFEDGDTPEKIADTIEND